LLASNPFHCPCNLLEDGQCGAEAKWEGKLYKVHARVVVTLDLEPQQWPVSWADQDVLVGICDVHLGQEGVATCCSYKVDSAVKVLIGYGGVFRPDELIHRVVGGLGEVVDQPELPIAL
jgi:hypothetical protein